MTKLPYALTSDQKDAIEKIKNRFMNEINPVCALPTGEGKTIISCALIKTLIEEGEAGFLVIVKANNLQDPWINELEKFSIPYSLIHGLERKDKRIDNKYPIKKGGVLLTSHHTAALDIDYFVNTGRFSLVIIDEIHMFNNSERLTNIMRQLSKINTKKKLFLTATPIQNRKYELGLLNIALNAPYTIYTLEPDNNINGEDLTSHYESAKNNKLLIQQNKHGQGTDGLPKRDIKISKTVLSVPLTNEMEGYINDNLDYFFYEKGNRLLYPKKRLYQYLSHPDSINKNNTDIKETVKCGKIDAVLSILNNIPKTDKIIIFSQYKDVLYRYFNLLAEKGYKAVIVTGEDRGGQGNKLRMFQETGIYRVLLTTLFKSAEGLNLKEANHVVILEFWWNPQRIIQAMGRIIRKNQEKDVFIYLLCYNINGAIYKYESRFWEVMEAKIAEAKETIPAQAELPDIEVFDNLNTYQIELEHFLKSFLYVEKKNNIENQPTRKKIKIKIVRAPNIENDEQFENSNIDIESPAVRNLFIEMAGDYILNNFENSDNKFDDIDLTGPSNEKP